MTEGGGGQHGDAMGSRTEKRLAVEEGRGPESWGEVANNTGRSAVLRIQPKSKAGPNETQFRPG